MMQRNGVAGGVNAMSGMCRLTMWVAEKSRHAPDGMQEAIEDPERNIFVIDHATTLLSTLTKDTKSPIIEQINNQPDSEVGEPSLQHPLPQEGHLCSAAVSCVV